MKTKMKKAAVMLMSLIMVMCYMPMMAFATDGQIDDTDVASIENQGYATLQAAVNAAKSGEIVTLQNSTEENIIIAAEKNITLDLNGHVLNGGTVASKPALTNNGIIVIKDSGINGEIKRSDVETAGYYTIDNQGTMTIESGKVYNHTGTMPNGASLIRNAGAGKAATLIISGGHIQQDGFIAVKNDDYGILSITGGTITTTGDTDTNTASAVQNWCKADITGGIINGTVWTGTWSADLDLSKTTIGGTANINGNI